MFLRYISTMPALLAASLTATALGLSSIAQADVRAAHTTLVSETASFFTPGALDGRVEAIEVVGDTVYVGGTFTQIQMALDGEIINQPYLFAYSKSTGAIITDFDPVLNNSVRALETTGEGSGIFVGGHFTIVNGETNRKGLVKLDAFGDRVSGFSARPDKRVYTMDRSGNTLYLGGNFTRIGSENRDYLAAVDTTTGEVLPNFNLDIDGAHTTNVITTEFPSVDEIEVTSDDELMVVVGNFKTIDGFDRSRLAVIEIGDRNTGEQTVVSAWNTDVYDVQCPIQRFPQYIFGMDVSPDNSYFVTGSSGFRRRGEPACDTTVRFDFGDLTNDNVQPTWVSYTGGDSVYEVAASDHAVYIGGHFEFINNDLGTGNTRGRGGVARDGFAALDPKNGLPLLDWQSDRNPRGLGVFSIEVEPEGLYIGDDTDFMNGNEHPKFKFLPMTTNKIARPVIPTLPTTLYSNNNGEITATPFDGALFGTTMAASAADRFGARGAMFLGGQMFYGDDNGTLWSSVRLEDGTFEQPTPVDLLGLNSGDWNISQVSGMFFDHDLGRIYYSKQGDSRLFFRSFTPAGPISGEYEFIADEQSDILWGDVRGMDVIGGHLYYGRTDGVLYRADMDGYTVVAGTSVAISGPGIDTLNWNKSLLAFSSDGEVIGNPGGGESQYEFEFAASAESNSFRKFEFEIQPGEPIDVRLTWDDPNAELNVFLRDPNNVLVDKDNNQSGPSPKWVSAPAGAGGIYTVSVKIKEGSTAYNVSVNPTVEVPEEPKGAEFNSTGSVDSGKWQVFEFEVEAGDIIDAQVSWASDATLKVFLRDETGAQIDKDTDESGSPEVVSAVATTSGTWSVGVNMTSGSADYNVLVNITE